MNKILNFVSRLIKALKLSLVFIPCKRVVPFLYGLKNTANYQDTNPRWNLICFKGATLSITNKNSSIRLIQDKSTSSDKKNDYNKWLKVNIEKLEAPKI